jgi:hypothetical protein
MSDQSDYQDYLAYQQHLAGAKAAPASIDPQSRPQPSEAEPSLQGGAVRSMGDVVEPGLTNGIGHGAVTQGTFGNAKMSSGADSPTGVALGTGGAMAAQGAIAGGPVAATEGTLAKLGMAGATNAAQGALSKPAGDDDLESRAKQAGLAGLLGIGGQALGNAAGKVGDYAMQKAANIKQYIPGLGTALADSGVWGTKGIMQGQVNQGIQDAEGSLQNGVNKMSGTIPSEPVADALRAKAVPYTQGTVGSAGPLPLPSENEGFVNSALSRGDEAAARGNLSPQDTLSLSRAIAKPAYNKMGDPLSAFKHQLSQTEGGALKSALKDAADAQGIPDVREALQDQSNFYKAKNGLDKKDSDFMNILKTGGKGALGAALGYGAGGVPGAVAGAAASSPLGLSTAGQVGTKAAQAAPYAAPALINALLAAQRSGQK